MGASFGLGLVSGRASAAVQSGGSGVQGSGPTYGSGTTDLLRWVEQLIAAATEEKTV